MLQKVSQQLSSYPFYPFILCGAYLFVLLILATLLIFLTDVKFWKFEFSLKWKVGIHYYTKCLIFSQNMMLHSVYWSKWLSDYWQIANSMKYFKEHILNIEFEYCPVRRQYYLMWYLILLYRQMINVRGITNWMRLVMRL